MSDPASFRAATVMNVLTQRVCIWLAPVGFAMWYFTLTGIHLAHVLFGTSLLAYLWTKARHRTVNIKVTECVASFWHLVDLLWIILFPLLYLQR